MIEQLETPVEFSEHYFGIEWLNTEDLIVDEKYQRPPQHSLIKSITENWDWRAVRTLAVSLRPNGERNIYAVIDGQQRLTAARESNIEKLPCQVYIDLTEAQEAELFLKLNNSKKPSANDMFRAKLVEGDQEAKLIRMACLNTGWEIDLLKEMRHGNEFATTTINSATILTTIYRTGGILHLQKVLNLAAGWKGQHLAGSAAILNGFSQFLLKHREVDMARFTEKLSQETPSSVLGKANQIIAAERSLGSSIKISTAKSLIKVFVSIYNKGLRNGRLEE